MAVTAFKSKPANTVGSLPAIGAPAPDFKLVGTDLSEVTKSAQVGKRVVLNIFPSVDTGVCAASVRHFNAAAGELDNTVVLCISADLPFAHKRFCAAEGLDKVIAASGFRSSFGADYGVALSDSPLAGLYARAVLVLDEQGSVIHSQLVPEITQEPDYDAALAVLQ